MRELVREFLRELAVASGSDMGRVGERNGERVGESR